MTEKKKYLETGQIVNTHGVRGEVKILPWADSPEFLLDFDTFFLEGKPLHVCSARVHKGCVIASLEGVNDVNAAMKLKGRTVYIDRDSARPATLSSATREAVGMPRVSAIMTIAIAQSITDMMELIKLLRPFSSLLFSMIRATSFLMILMAIRQRIKTTAAASTVASEIEPILTPSNTSKIFIFRFPPCCKSSHYSMAA